MRNEVNGSFNASQQLCNFQIEITAYKKFRTLYRQHMLKMKEELCGQLSLKNHPIFGLFKTAGLPIEVGGVGGNLLDPCPLFVCRTVDIFYLF